ncbi:MAG: ornithine carbamoyltransferase [Actinobacteria bacterium]|uniref:ornithine carbamoyltransferase n=1 Tax=freshwater metagenome TaxID=449393 RepID=A0A6J6Q566_9ZZZZ|nr:ornithine carbamoyltransferase [Actinomycetota bacterium]
MALFGRDFLKESDFTAAELSSLLSLAAELKAQRKVGKENPRLIGKQLALIFAKSSTRTRIAFEVAMRDQGGHVTVLDPASSQIGHKESIADTARVLSRIFDGIEYRGHGQVIVEELAEFSDVPVYNGLTDEWHPTQMLADFLTMYEHAGLEHSGGDQLRYSYVGDARSNMGNSLLVMGSIMGADVRIVAPKSLWPESQVQALAQERARQSGASILITDDVAHGLSGAQFVHTDIWVSMGESTETWDSRVAALRPYRVDEDLMALTGNPEAKFMHCLPAYHDQNTAIGREVAQRFGLTDGVEVSDAVFNSRASIVFDQAENRMHSIKAVLVATLCGEPIN